MREKYQSQTFRKGEPDDHKITINLTCDFIDNLNIEQIWYDKKAYFQYPKEFRVKPDYPEGHSPDLVVWMTVDYHDVILAFIEMDGDLGGKKDGVKYSPTKHSKKNQKINDGIFKAYIEKYHPQSKLIRLKKERVFEEGESYLRQELLFLE